VVSSSLLLVDDDPEILAALALILDARGIAYRTAATGEEALTAAQAESPALIFLDLHLPGMDGIEVFTRLQALGISAPTVLMSANARDLHERVGQLGFVATLAKPFSMAEVYALVDRFAG
jgi:DNA-binding response OmpR family regulator